MGYEVILPERVADNLKRIEKRYRDQLYVALKGLEDRPLLGKKLWGQYKNYRSLRVGDYRIIYQIKASELVVLVIKIGNRQGVY